jgi:glutamate formiminotransferase/formiminotetrahydrofolate cyclodeaminase
VAETALEAMDLALAMARNGNPNSVTDAGVAALALRAAVRGAVLNVRINAAGLADGRGAEWENRAAALVEAADRLERDVLEAVETVLQAPVS